MKQCVRMTVDVFVARYQDAKLPQNGALTLSRLHRITWTNKQNTRLMALCPWPPGWGGTRKVKPIWILLKQETVSGSGISWATCKSAPCSRQITAPAPHHSVFLQAGCPSCRPTNSVKALKATITWTLLQIHCRIFQWKSFENRLRVDRIMATSLLGIELNQRPCGWPSRHIIIVIISIHLSANNSTNIL